MTARALSGRIPEDKESDVPTDSGGIGPLLDRVRENLGLDLTLYREGTIMRRIARRMAARNCPDLESYSELLGKDTTEYQELLRDLTIKYTEFFRDPFVFDALRERVFPEILRGSHPGPASVWSAGCATGEETYSIAVAAIQTREERLSSRAVTILGTDVDDNAVRAAEAGVYFKALLPALPDAEAMRFFADHGDTLSAGPEIREMVSFRSHNLLGRDARRSLRDMACGSFDLVVCRNVLIYLKREAQASVVELLVDMLAPGGFLIVGTGENIPRCVGSRLAAVDAKARIHRLTA